MFVATLYSHAISMAANIVHTDNNYYTITLNLALAVKLENVDWDQWRIQKMVFGGRRRGPVDGACLIFYWGCALLLFCILFLHCLITNAEICDLLMLTRSGYVIFCSPGYYVWRVLGVLVNKKCCRLIDSRFSVKIRLDDKLPDGKKGRTALCSSRRCRSQLLCRSASLHVFPRCVDKFSYGIIHLLVQKRPSSALWMC